MSVKKLTNKELLEELRKDLHTLYDQVEKVDSLKSGLLCKIMLIESGFNEAEQEHDETVFINNTYPEELIRIFSGPRCSWVSTIMILFTPSSIRARTAASWLVQARETMMVMQVSSARTVKNLAGCMITSERILAVGYKLKRPAGSAGPSC